ncbi:LAFE_0H15896g1_1 [Lachancea fermentati]|uniref:LAFE_0H15896g1_1 n=1 Tax=Lachancea fermentati TaxID=4955 RepID=A0A1G4MKW8_LACFM|nr:LAFE_0H15896g1_1 [Lachancea fermentati]
MALTPEVLWAQRSSDSDKDKNYLLVTLLIPDCEQPHLDLDATHLEFTAKSPGHVGDEHEHKYHLRIDFYKEIDPESSLHKVANGRDYFLKLYKKDLDAEYWPRLTKEKLKYHFIKTDFDKWVDEDEQEEHVDEDFGFGGEGQGFPGGGQAAALQEMLKGQGMGGMGGMGGMDGADQAAALQEMLKGQGMGGMGDMGGMGGADQAAALQELLKNSGQGLEGLDELEEEHDLDEELAEEEKAPEST